MPIPPIRPSREQIYQALFSLVSSAKVLNPQGIPVPAFVTSSRRFVIWASVPANMQPALFQIQAGEDPQAVTQGMPPRWVMNVHLYIYVNLGGDSSIGAPPPSSLLNPILDAIEVILPARPVAGPPAAVFGVPTDYQRLGFPPGSVQEVRIMHDKIVIEEGLLSDQSQTVALVPVRIIRT